MGMKNVKKCSRCGTEINPKRRQDYYCRNCWNEYQRQWRKKNRDKVKKTNKKWKKNNPEIYKEFRKRQYTKYRDRRLKEEREKRQENRRIVINHYSKGENNCACCKENQINFLSIDHMNNDGAKHRREIRGISGGPFYSWLIKNNFPEGLQILCFNCNFAKGHYGECPHKGRPQIHP